RLALARALPLKQGCHDALRGDQSDHMIGKYHRHVTRLAARAAVTIGDTPKALDDCVVNGPVSIAPAAAQAPQISYDEALVSGPGRLGAELERGQCRRLHIGDENIGGGYQPM